MYIPGRRRTASSPSRTWMSFALYEGATLGRRLRSFGASFLTAIRLSLRGGAARTAARNPRRNRTEWRYDRHVGLGGPQPSFRAPRAARSSPVRGRDRRHEVAAALDHVVWDAPSSGRA